MPNDTPCQILIKQGKNIGMKCCDVSRRCRHAVIICRNCGMELNRSTTYTNHLKICRIRPKIVKKVQPEDLYEKIHIMEQQIQQLLKTPTVVNVNNVYQNNINISDIGAFKTLCDKMGINEATDFLCDLAAKPQIMALFEKVYLECDPAQYPIANNNGKDFMYRDAENNIVHDEGGHKITELGERLIKNTFIEAADPLLTRFISQNEGEHDGDDTDYDRFRELQNGACRIKRDRSFVKDLYPKTYNPGHVFFSTT